MSSEAYASSALTADPAAARQPPLLPLVTLVLWVGCLLVGVRGLAEGPPHVRVKATEPEPPPVEVRTVNVDLDPPPLTPGDAVASGDPAEAGPVQAAEAAPAVPDLPAVAAPGAAVAFASPVEGPVRIVEARQARPVAPTPNPGTRNTTGTAGGTAGGGHPGGTAATAPAVHAPRIPPPVTRLTFGEGQGDQPLPEYPREARIGRQEGTVLVRFAVGEDGRVLWAQVATPCPWPLLNQSAQRCILETWHFPPAALGASGAPRLYEVPIEFGLKVHE